MYPTVSLFYAATLIISQAVSAAGPLPIYSQQQIITYSPSISDLGSNSLKVPGESPANYCSDPSSDLFQIQRLDFLPKNPRIGYYLTIRFFGRFTAATGDIPWLNITGSFNGQQFVEPLYDAPLCEIDVFQHISVPRPDGGYSNGLHRACPPAIRKGYTEIWSPPIPLHPMFIHEGEWVVNAEAMTQDGRRIFCVEGAFNITK